MPIRPQRLLHDSLLRSAESSPEKPAVVADGEALTYAELLDRASRLARALQDQGLERGDRVGILMENSASAAATIFGILLAGGVFIVINPQTKEDKLAYVLEDSRAAFLVSEGPITRIAALAAPRVSSLKGLIAARAPELPDGAVGFDELVTAADPTPREVGTIPVDLAALIYTSGSTGQPKGVMMTHANMVFVAGSVAQYLRLEPEDRILGLLPLAFDYGLYQLFMSVRLGGTLVLEKSFAFPAQIVKRVREEDVTVFPGVPTVYATLISMSANTDVTMPSVRRVTNTAAALLPAYQEGLRGVFPNALIFAMYGLTECKRVAYLEPELLDEKPSSVGRAIPGTETLVLNEEGVPVAPGEAGILHVRGPHVMVGYWGKPDLTAEMLREGPLPGERMLCTHDWFTVDEDGFLYFQGRSDDIIKTRAEKVSPVEVENALVSIEGIREAAVIGVPDEILGQAIKAFVSLAEGAALAEQDVIAACRLRLENFMVPSEVVFLSELPKTPTGKIRKKSLQEEAAV